MQEILAKLVSSVANPIDGINNALKSILALAVVELEQCTSDEAVNSMQGKLKDQQQLLMKFLDSCNFIHASSMSAIKGFELCKKLDGELLSAINSFSNTKRMEMRNMVQRVVSEFQNTLNQIVQAAINE